MLRKIISIKNVGRFLNYGAGGDVELKRYNLIFAENGRGKTTLCAILRSLQSGDPSHVLGRTTLGSTDLPEIKMLLNPGTAHFTSGAWSTTVPNIAIFDSTFVSENVHSGDVVAIDHRRGLYRVIVGKDGVELAQQIDRLDSAIRTKNTEIKDRTAAVQAHLPKGVTFEAFLALDEHVAIDEKLDAKEKELTAVRQADQIKARAGLSEITFPAFFTGFEALLAKTIEGIAEDAERLVVDQIKAHAMHETGEAWLSEGVGYSNDTCPFCSQPLKAVAALVGAYKAYFSDSYNALRAEIAAVREEIETTLSDREIAKLEKAIDLNTATADFWSKFCAITIPAIQGATDPATALRTLREAALGLLDRKAVTPLYAIDPDAAFTTAHAAVLTAHESAVAYNQAVTAANTIISGKKTVTGAADIKAVESALTLLQASKKRYATDGKQACDDYQSALAQKKDLETEKTAVRDKLDHYTKRVIGKYEQTINRLLKEFHAGFRITETKHGYPGGVASSSYQILINDAPVELGDPTTPLDKPSFQNTLSSGDKSTLALAFFLAQVEHDSDRAVKIVIFDDPFNSQDSFRKDCTVQKIKNCGGTSAQVIVLSHDQSFLKRIYDRLETQTADRKCLEMRRIGLTNTTICEWDIEKATQDIYKADRKTLTDYYHHNAGNPRDVIQKIRPVLETYCKNLGAGALIDTDALGIIIGKIRTAGATHQLFCLCDGLDELNEYTKRYHHGENPNAATEPISDTALQGYVRQTLEMSGGC